MKISKLMFFYFDFLFIILVAMDETLTPSDHPKANTIFMTKSFSERKYFFWWIKFVWISLKIYLNKKVMIISIIKVSTTITYHYLKSIIGVRIMMFTFLILFYFSCLKCFNFNKTFNTKKFMLQHFFFQNRAFILSLKC